MKALAIFKYISALIGLAFFIGAWFSYKSTTDFLDRAEDAEGEVIEMIRSRSDDSYTYKPVVEFTTPSGVQIEFTSSTSSNPPSYDVGEIVDVLYDPEDPNNARIDGAFSLWFLPVFLSIFGLIFAGIGTGLLAVGIMFNRKRQYLATHGEPIQARYKGVEKNTSLKVNGRNPYNLIGEWQNPSTGEIHIFKSENLWYDPEDYVDVETVTVLIAPGNPRKYLMDTEFLPKMAD
jgi:hypothetical protein